MVSVIHQSLLTTKEDQTMLDTSTFNDCLSPDITTTSTTTAKQTARAVRVWLENKQLLEWAGFFAGSSYSIRYGIGTITLTLDSAGTGRVSVCRRGDKLRPIIDLHNAKVAASLTAGKECLVTYGTCTITIKQ
jgi:hypothetical protein